MIDRRTLIATSAAFAVAGASNAQGAKPMYGLIGQMKAVPGRRAELAAILLEGTDDMPGCLSYIVAEDTADSKQSHADSLNCPPSRRRSARAVP